MICTENYVQNVLVRSILGANGGKKFPICMQLKLTFCAIVADRQCCRTFVRTIAILSSSPIAWCIIWHCEVNMIVTLPFPAKLYGLITRSQTFPEPRLSILRIPLPVFVDLTHYELKIDDCPLKNSIFLAWIHSGHGFRIHRMSPSVTLPIISGG